MEIKVLKDEKEYLEVDINSLTMAELLRNDLWEDSSVQIAAWKRDHPSKNPILIIKTKGKSAKKVLQECIERLSKVNDKVVDEFKKSIK